MGNCDSKICESSDFKVSADPDVAGIGVLLAFATSAVLALLAMIYGYCTDSFPENTLTEFDHYFLLTPMRRRLRRCVEVASWLLGGSSTKVQTDVGVNTGAAREKRRKAVERFVLALSDQQLVTGLAVLIAGYMKNCSMPLYYFNIIASLAWFSSTTHLATLGALREYLILHPMVRDWRVVAMIAVLALLFLAQPPSWSDTDGSVPIFCIFEDADIAVSFSSLITLITTLGFLVVMYVQRIARLYSLDLDWNISDSLIEALVKLLAGKSYQEPSRKKIAKVAQSENSKIRISTLIREERERIRYTRFKSAMENSQGRLKAYTTATIFIAIELSYGFLSQVTVLVFELAFGITQTINYRTETPYGGIEGDQNEMGFGQLVPLILLLLPALAVGELYFEHHDKSSQDDHNASGDLNPSTSSINMQQSGCAPSETLVSADSSIELDTDTPIDNGNSGCGDVQSAQTADHPTPLISLANRVTRLEEVLTSLNSSEVLTTPNSTAEGSSNVELDRFGHPSRQDTGWALRQVHDYETERPASPNLNLGTLQDITEELIQILSDQTIESAETTSSSSTRIATSESTHETLHTSTPQRSTGQAVSKRVYSKIHYHRILTCVFLFQYTFQLLFALALGGEFGARGYLLASCFLVVLMAVAVIVVIDGTRWRLLEVKEENLKAAKRLAEVCRG